LCEWIFLECTLGVATLLLGVSTVKGGLHSNWGNKGGGLLLSNNCVASLDGANVLHTSLHLSYKASRAHVLASAAGNHLLDDLRVLHLGDLRSLNHAGSLHLVLLHNGALAVDGARHVLHSLAGHLDHAGHLLDHLARHLHKAGLSHNVLLSHLARHLHNALDRLQKVAGLLHNVLLLHHTGHVHDTVVEGLARVLLNDGLVLHHSAGHKNLLGVHHNVGLVDNVSHRLSHGAGLHDGVGHSLHHSVLGGNDLRHLHSVGLGDELALHVHAVLHIGVLAGEEGLASLAGKVGMGELLLGESSDGLHFFVF
jgi:hypothetical protein